MTVTETEMVKPILNCVVCGQPVRGRKRIDAQVCVGECARILARERTRAWKDKRPFSLKKQIGVPDQFPTSKRVVMQEEQTAQIEYDNDPTDDDINPPEDAALDLEIDPEEDDEPQPPEVPDLPPQALEPK